MGLRREWLKSKGNDGKFNKSTFFLLPMIGLNLNDFISFDGHKNYLIDCYINNKFDGNLTIVCEYNEDDQFNLLLYKLQANPCFKGENVDVENSEIIIYCLIPDRHIEDFNLILDGRYSRLSKSYKDRLTSIYGRKSNIDNHKCSIYDSLYPTETKRKQLAEYLGYDIHNNDWKIIDEVLDKFELDKNLYCSIEDIKKIYQAIL